VRDYRDWPQLSPHNDEPHLPELGALLNREVSPARPTPHGHHLPIFADLDFLTNRSSIEAGFGLSMSLLSGDLACRGMQEHFRVVPHEQICPESVAPLGPAVSAVIVSQP
jgi:hypothetical protein